jgi:hypothetical protein
VWGGTDEYGVYEGATISNYTLIVAGTENGDRSTPPYGSWAPERAWGASGATGYLLSPKIGEEGVVVGMYFVPPT